MSNSLRELQAWGIVQVVHTLGDRRDYFESIRDVWELSRLIVAERFQREIEPTMRVLGECVAEAEGRKADEPETWSRLANLHEFLRTLDAWREQLMAMSPHQMKRASKIGGKVAKLLRTGS